MIDRFEPFVLTAFLPLTMRRPEIDGRVMASTIHDDMLVYAHNLTGKMGEATGGREGKGHFMKDWPWGANQIVCMGACGFSLEEWGSESACWGRGWGRAPRAWQASAFFETGERTASETRAQAAVIRKKETNILHHIPTAPE